MVGAEHWATVRAAVAVSTSVPTPDPTPAAAAVYADAYGSAAALWPRDTVAVPAGATSVAAGPPSTWAASAGAALHRRSLYGG